MEYIPYFGDDVYAKILRMEYINIPLFEYTTF
jgi:hypothetical protein